MQLAIGLSMLVSAVFGGKTAVASSTPPAPVVRTYPQAQTLQSYVRSYFSATPIMGEIAECESHFHQYGADGSLYRGEINPSDVGVMQINEHYHLTQAQALGMNITTLQGNLEFAQYLYDTEGTDPWDSSRPCWAPKAQALGLSYN